MNILSFPYKDTVSSVFGTKPKINSIISSIQCILTTPKGSIPYDPELGSQIPYLIHDSLTSNVINLIYYYVVNDIETQETRVKVKSIVVDTITEKNMVIVQVGFVLRNDPNQKINQAPAAFARGI